MFTDTHCHISKKDYENIDEIIKNATEAGIHKMINNGADYESNQEVLEISSKFSNVYAAIGFHPQNLENFKEEYYTQIEENIDKIVAIGEIGLDYYNGYEDKEKQKEVFEKQLQLAEKYNKPVIVHSRRATEDTINILKKYPNVKGDIHCFSGSIETAKIYIKMGYKLGFNGVITFKNANTYKIIEEIPDESILLETDCPYLTPEPFRGHRNEPKYIANIAERVYNIKYIAQEELSKITEKNVKDLFDI